MSDLAKNARLVAEQAAAKAKADAAAAAAAKAKTAPAAVVQVVGLTPAMRLDVQAMIDADRLKHAAPVAVSPTPTSTVTQPVAVTAPVAIPVPVTPPAVPSAATKPKLPPCVWKQPIRLMPSWISRGIRCFDGWEEERDPNNGNAPTVSIVAYLDAALAAGATVIVQLDAEQPIPWHHPAIVGFGQRDEADDAVVNEQDKGASGNVEGVYVGLETAYKLAKQNRPDLPVYANIDGAQVEYKKPNYARIFAACDYVTFDFYETTRGITFAEWCQRFEMVAAIAGSKLVGAYIGTSYQNLGHTYYPNEYAPTPAQTQQVIDFLKGKGMAWPIFPQSFDPFRYDNTPADVVAVIQQNAQ